MNWMDVDGLSSVLKSKQKKLVIKKKKKKKKNWAKAIKELCPQFLSVIKMVLCPDSSADPTYCRQLDNSFAFLRTINEC